MAPRELRDVRTLFAYPSTAFVANGCSGTSHKAHRHVEAVSSWVVTARDLRVEIVEVKFRRYSEKEYWNIRRSFDYDHCAFELKSIHSALLRASDERNTFG